jgi:O-antigen ligase
MRPSRERAARVGVILRERAARVGVTQGIQVTLVEALTATYGVGVVALFVSGRVDIVLAGILFGGPVVLALALLRPEWTILVMVALPPSVTSPIPTSLLILFMAAALFGFVLQGRLHLWSGTGIYPLVGIIVLAFAMKATVPAEATAAADEVLKSIISFTLVMLVAFNAVANDRIRIDSFVNALLLGIVVSAVLQPFLASSLNFESINISPFRGKFAYLAAMGFGVAYVRLSLNRNEGRRRSRLDAFLALVFLCLTFIGFGRAAWIATLWVFALVSRWTRRKTFWLVASLFLVLVFTVPLVAERIVPVSETDIGTQATLDEVTSGRSELWERLYARGVEALPFGQGWGYVESLSPVDLFGFETFVTESQFIYPHNDFLYVFVELGIVGFGLLAVFWLTLFQRVRRLTRSPREPIRYSVMVLVPVLIVMFMVQMFDNGFAIDFVADRFFAAAGLVFGLYYSARESVGVGPQMARPRASWQGRQLPATRPNVVER